jgi:ABC-type polysaccharide/polyol phosphate export permease
MAPVYSGVERKRRLKIAALALVLSITYLLFVGWIVANNNLQTMPSWLPLVIFVVNLVCCVSILKWYARRLQTDQNKNE